MLDNGLPLVSLEKNLQSAEADWAFSGGPRLAIMGDKHREAGQVLWHLCMCLPLSKPCDMSAGLSCWDCHTT